LPYFPSSISSMPLRAILANSGDSTLTIMLPTI
jgi:hypothetical protein